MLRQGGGRSSQMVNGPSFTSGDLHVRAELAVGSTVQATPLAARFRPPCTSGRASSGGAALVKTGSPPAAQVGIQRELADEQELEPPVSTMDRLVLPSASSKQRSSAIFSASLLGERERVAAAHAQQDPASPPPIWPTVRPSTLTRRLS